eukprot:4349073-Amphidinium_carterae.1
MGLFILSLSLRKHWGKRHAFLLRQSVSNTSTISGGPLWKQRLRTRTCSMCRCVAVKTMAPGTQPFDPKEDGESKAFCVCPSLLYTCEDIENLLANFTDANKKLDLIQKGLRIELPLCVGYQHGSHSRKKWLQESTSSRTKVAVLLRLE